MGRRRRRRKKTQHLSIYIQKPKSEIVFKHVLTQRNVKQSVTKKLAYRSAKIEGIPLSVVECSELGFCTAICKVVMELHAVSAVVGWRSVQTVQSTFTPARYSSILETKQWVSISLKSCVVSGCC